VLIGAAAIFVLTTMGTSISSIFSKINTRSPPRTPASPEAVVRVKAKNADVSGLPDVPETFRPSTAERYADEK
jgi:hypothetical protein